MSIIIYRGRERNEGGDLSAAERTYEDAALDPEGGELHRHVPLQPARAARREFANEQTH